MWKSRSSDPLLRASDPLPEGLGAGSVVRHSLRVSVRAWAISSEVMVVFEAGMVISYPSVHSLIVTLPPPSASRRNARAEVGSADRSEQCLLKGVCPFTLDSDLKC